MAKFIFLKVLFICGVVAVFLKIYQENRIVKLQYEKQRLEHDVQRFQKIKERLCIDLAVASDSAQLKFKAAEICQMKELPLARLITFTGFQS